jgi:hypothetical protein
MQTTVGQIRPRNDAVRQTASVLKGQGIPLRNNFDIFFLPQVPYLHRGENLVHCIHILACCVEGCARITAYSEVIHMDGKRASRFKGVTLSPLSKGGRAGALQDICPSASGFAIGFVKAYAVAKSHSISLATFGVTPEEIYDNCSRKRREPSWRSTSINTRLRRLDLPQGER